ncbi:MAG: type IX secretion system PorP/SprF family membrane protein [Crocinitomicaceae bacterium]|jgi:type IX secretion system PorP/SprF family membrane protein
MNLERMKMINKIFTALFALLVTYSASAQQESHYINLTNNPYLLNPAAGGMTSTFNVEATSRTQWLGYDGGPRTMAIVGNSPVRFGKGEKVLKEYNPEGKAFYKAPERTTGSMKHVLGGIAMTDVIGPFNRTSVQASYSIHLPLIKSINIGAGLSVGWSNFRINQDRVTLYQADDPAYSQFLGSTSAQNIANANAGIVFYNEELFVGISTSQLLRNTATFGGIETGSNYNRHYYFMAKYAFEAADKFQIEPTAVLKIAENSPMSLDAGARFIYNKSVWLGIQYRTTNALTFQLGANLIKNFYLAYGYEQGIGAIQLAGNSTHEIQLGFHLGNNRTDKKELKNKDEKTEE